LLKCYIKISDIFNVLICFFIF